MPSERVQRRIDRLLDQAEEAAENFEWNRVHEAATSVLAVDPENEDAPSFLAMATPHISNQALVGTSSDHSAREVSVSPSVTASTDSSTNLPASAQPSSFSSGRYTVSKFLGEGGKKKVYLAHDNTLDRDVAFALIKTEGLDETGRERVKREAQAMGRMGTHPCIMPIYDLGEENGQPFMVQPLMGGGDVEGLIEEAEGPLELDRALEITIQTAQGLSFAHSKGIVHRDLKPGNVWMDEDGAAKIGDFGLAVATDRSRLTVEKMIVGTVAYMPPEQATGGEVTPRADLYSLGAMLYEMSTGRPPFLGDDDIAIISQHVNTPPVAPSWHNSKIPKTLDSLVMRLLAKDPHERPESADEVLSALQSVDLSVSTEETSEDSKGSLDAMASGVFVGRHREMDQLKSVFEEVLSGKGRMLTLVGEPGAGKTRTAQELATYAGLRKATVLWGRSYETGGAPPYWPWVQAIRSYVAITEPETLRNQMGISAPVIAQVVPDVGEKLIGLATPTQIDDPDSARFRLFDSITNFLKNVSQAVPLVLMLEDLHWSDKPSLMLLEFVARELSNSRILIVGNYRDMELNRRHPLAVALGDLTRERLFERIVLRGLQRHDVERFIEIAAGVTPPAALVDTVHSQTEGNPLFVTETVRLLIQEGNISSGQHAKGSTTSWEIRIPEGVREVIGRRLDRLSERCNEVLTTAAVMGRQFRFPVLLELSDEVTENMLLDVMDEALSARVIEELPEEIGLYQFTHTLMQETLTSELSANRTVRLHARVAEALEEHYGDNAHDHAAELVEHFIEAEAILGAEKASEYSLEVGRRSLEALAFDEAVLHFKRVVEFVPIGSNDQVRAEAIAGLAIAYGATAQPEMAITTSVDAFNLLVGIGDNEGAVAVALSISSQGMRPWQELERGLYGRARKITSPETPESVDLLARHARTFMGSDFEIASREIDQALTEAERIGEPSLLARCESSAASIFGMNGRWEPTLKHSLNAIKQGVAAEIADPQWLGHVWAANTYEATGHPDLADNHSRMAVEISQQVKNRGWEASALGGFARTAMFQGNWESAEGYISTGLEMHPRDGRLIAVQNRIKLDFGDFKSLRMSPEETELGLHVWPAFYHASIALMTGDPDPARQARQQFDFEFPDGINVIDNWSAESHTSAILAVLERDTETASVGLDLFEYWSGWITHQGVSGDRLLGLLAGTSVQTGKAIEYFEKGLKLCRDSGYRPENGWLCCNYSDLLLDRSAPGDREKAIELQDEAISIATEMGMKPLLERVLAKREILKA